MEVPVCSRGRSLACSELDAGEPGDSRSQGRLLASGLGNEEEGELEHCGIVRECSRLLRLQDDGQIHGSSSPLQAGPGSH